MKICYFGIYDPGFGRNKVYMDGLRALGHAIVECRDTSPGWVKYWRLRRRHAAIMREGGYDLMIVGYPGHVAVPLAKKLAARASKRLGRRIPVVFDALCTLYEAEVLSRGKTGAIARSKIEFIDEAAVEAADLILVETEAQREFFIKRFALSPEKAARVTRVFTGCDESVFNPAITIAHAGVSGGSAAPAKKRDRFTAVFRGKFLPEAGVRHIIEAAKALEGQGVDFLILGHGFLEADVRAQLESLKPSNLEWQGGFLSPGELARRMAECHVSLGQFERHERLERTIPHKAFESLALGLPYLTARAAGISELLTDGRDCLMVEPGSPSSIVEKLLQLRDDPELARSLAQNGRALAVSRLSATRLAQDILDAASAILRP